MDQSRASLYKNSLYLSTAIFILVMCAATTASAQISHGKPALVNTLAEVPTPGRCIVTPASPYLVGSATATADGRGNNASTRGAI